MALDIDASYLGGVNTNELLFNWHPILMVSGLIFSSITAILAYRFLPLEKTTVKYIHAFFHSASIVCVVLGVSAVFQCKLSLFSYRVNIMKCLIYLNHSKQSFE